MPASVADPVQLVLRTAFSGKKATFPRDDEDGPDLLEERLAASAKRVLHTNIEYEPAPKQQVLALDSLKSKYIVLNAASHHSAKVAALNGQNNQIVQHDGLPPPKVTLFRYEDVKVGWKGPVPVGAGMINMGNTCYMNSTLQALLHVPSLANWLLSGHHCKNCDPNGTQLCTICIISKTLQSTHEKTNGVIKPVLVYNRLKMICKHMVHGRQEDAHEFMRYLIESMEKAYLQSVGATKLDTRSKETNPLGQIFGGYIRTEVTCLKCKHVSITFQHFQDIPLDIQHASTLEDNLSYYFRRERLEGDNAYKCDKCKNKVPATKKFSIERAPNVLCVQLKRFGLMGGKMSKHVQFPRQLNLGRFLFNQQLGSSSATYKFVSLINHMGPSQHCGHYTAVAEAANGQFYLFDDCSVRTISLNIALNTGAYVLIYERIQSPPSSSSNIQAKLNSIQSATASPSPSPAIPRPAIISEPLRPKINFELKKNDAGAAKPRLVIRNGDQPLFKSAASLNGAVSATAGTSLQAKALVPAAPAPPVASENKPSDSKPNGVVPTVAATKPVLVPYDSESGEDDEDEEVAKSSVSTTNATGATSVPPTPALKATETKWQVSPSPTPSDSTSSVSANGTSGSKWQVSDNGHQDGGSNSSSSAGSNSSTNIKWVVRSLSDTESEKATMIRKRPASSQRGPSGSLSDTEMDPTGSSKSSAPLARFGNKIRLLGESVKARFFRPPPTVSSKTNGTVSSVHVASASESASPEAKKENSEVKSEDKPIIMEPKTKSVSTDATASSNQRTGKTNPLPNGSAAEPPKMLNIIKNVKWDGNRTTGVVKDLLRMSHSGFDDQVRTWDGGKSHVTKQVEEDKRIQRKRTVDELHDEELDRGKVKKVKSDKHSRDSSPVRSYNPFQKVQNERNRGASEAHFSPYHKSNGYHNSKDKYRHQNRPSHYGNHRFGGGGGGHHRSNSSNHRPHSNHRPWKRFR